MSLFADAPPKVLFVCGYNTLGDDTYKNMDYLTNVSFFVYANKESLASIEDRLLKEYSAEFFDILIGHSLGCFLITRLLQKLGDITSQNVLFINPYITNDCWELKLMKYTPTCLFHIPTPNFTHYIVSFSSISYNIRKPSLFGLHWSQLLQIKKASAFMDLKEFSKTYARHNVSIIYGLNDSVAPLSAQSRAVLERVSVLIPLYCNHEPMTDDYCIQKNLKNKICAVLASIDGGLDE